jgi:hypothetical protein
MDARGSGPPVRGNRVGVAGIGAPPGVAGAGGVPPGVAGTDGAPPAGAPGEPPGTLTRVT